MNEEKQLEQRLCALHQLVLDGMDEEFRSYHARLGEIYGPQILKLSFLDYETNYFNQHHIEFEEVYGDIPDLPMLLRRQGE